ncbi:MAG: peptidyl-prolyl cis-trans isomerase, partial [Endomicrobium sp.]|nr:peptidyl-prolyl cis-trans isomerase [Endomicrobium sp.]
LPAREEAVISNLAAILKKTSGEHIKIRQIFVSLPKGANAQTVKSASLKIAAIKKQLQKQTFSDIAAEYSDDPVLRQRSGDIGLVAKGDLLPVLDKAAFSLKIGEYTKEPVKTDIGYFFLKVEEKHAKKDITFKNVKNEINEVLVRLNAAAVQNEYINGLKAKANIKINKTW